MPRVSAGDAAAAVGTLQGFKECSSHARLCCTFKHLDRTTSHYNRPCVSKLQIFHSTLKSRHERSPANHSQLHERSQHDAHSLGTTCVCASQASKLERWIDAHALCCPCRQQRAHAPPPPLPPQAPAAALLRVSSHSQLCELRGQGARRQEPEVRLCGRSLSHGSVPLISPSGPTLIGSAPCRPSNQLCHQVNYNPRLIVRCPREPMQAVAAEGWPPPPSSCSRNGRPLGAWPPCPPSNRVAPPSALEPPT